MLAKGFVAGALCAVILAVLGVGLPVAVALGAVLGVGHLYLTGEFDK